MTLDCREIVYGSLLYAKTVELRERVLRAPLGLPWEAEAFAGEEHSFHLAIFSGETLLGCLVLKPLDESYIKMRQVAIEPAAQGCGAGRQLVEFAEGFARARGFREMSAHAREAVASFYRKLGYDIVGEPFVEVSIPHVSVVKKLEA